MRYPEIPMGPQLHGNLPVHEITRKRSLAVRPQGKYNRVGRALPFKETEAECEWSIEFTPSGRLVFEPVP